MEGSIPASFEISTALLVGSDIVSFAQLSNISAYNGTLVPGAIPDIIPSQLQTGTRMVTLRISTHICFITESGGSRIQGAAVSTSSRG